MLKIVKVNDIRKVEFKFNRNYAITHSGKFHLDDVMSAVLLVIYYGYLLLLRVDKVPNDLPSNVVVFDIGGGEFDHHQSDGNGIRENGVPYASCGLIWRKYGMEIVRRTGTTRPDLVFKWVDEELIQSIDATDCGEMPKVAYPAKPFTLSMVISKINPQWYSENKDFDECFMKAYELAKLVFYQVLEGALGKVKSQKGVEFAIENSRNHIMILPRLMPWKEWLYTSENPKAKDIWFVVYPSDRGGYNFQSVPSQYWERDQRKAVPKSWRGAPVEQLRRISGVPDATFVHPAGYIGGAETLNGAVNMAKKLVS